MGDNTTHSTLSPSARHRWGVCPGSVREEAKYPEPPGGQAANDGTRTHALLERAILFEFVNKEGVCGPAPYYGTTITDEFGTYTVDLERAQRVNVALEYIRSRVAELGNVEVIPERRVHPDGFVGRADMSGTVDVQIRSKHVLEITDYKDGMHPVSAVDNPQLEQYAIGALAEIPADLYPKMVRMTIVQPKLAVKGMPPITSHEIPVAELLAKVEVIKAQAAATDDPNAPLVPGESQCKYCRAKGACPALAAKAMSEVNVMFGPVTPVLPDVLEPAHQAANQNPEAMSNDQLRQLLEAEPLLKQLMEGAKAEVQRRLEAGQAVPGFKLVNGRGTRKWALPEEEIAKKLKGMGVPKEAIFETKLVSPAAAEKLVWEKKGEMVQLSKIQIERLNKEYVTTVVGKPTVAPESDSRQAVILDASSMFGAIEPVGVQIDYSKADTGTVVLPPAPAPEPAPVPEWLSVPAWLR